MALGVAFDILKPNVVVLKVYIVYIKPNLKW